MKRNQRGDDKMYVAPENKGYSNLTGLYKKGVEDSKESQICIDGVQGSVLITIENVLVGRLVIDL